MNNKTAAKILEELGIMIELSGGNPFSARAHYNSARIIESLPKPIESLVNSNGIGEIKGIGKGLSDKIKELVTTGHIEDYTQLKSDLPDGLFDILRIPGLGPKKVRVLYKTLGITDLGELENACTENRIATLERFGRKTQENIISGIGFLRIAQEQHLYHHAQTHADQLITELKKLPAIIRIEIAGSLRRHKETIKDIDIIASTHNEGRDAVMEYFTKLPNVSEIIGRGQTKSSVRLESGISADLRLVTDVEYPFALHHFTGSKEHNTTMRARAKTYGLKMNEYGLFKNDTSLKCISEEDIFSALELSYIEPEMRENLGEINAAAENKLPGLVTPQNIKGILHVHTTYSDGVNSIEEMVIACMERGYSYLGICDHSVSAFYANGLSEDRVKKQHDEIDRLNENYNDFVILKGIESDILIDGSLDYSDSVLESFDFVVASVHSKLKMTEDEAAQRLENAVKNPFATILGHPTGRLLLSREGYPLSLYAIIETAQKYNTIIEINASPHRLDLDWRYGKYAKEKIVKIAVNPDAHSTQGLDDIVYGIGIARKGWLEADDIVNTMTADEISRYFKTLKEQ